MKSDPFKGSLLQECPCNHICVSSLLADVVSVRDSLGMSSVHLLPFVEAVIALMLRRSLLAKVSPLRKMREE